MFGNFPDDWTAPSPLTGELIVYVILYFIVVFLLMQNFLLAIIVEVSAPPLAPLFRALLGSLLNVPLALLVDFIDIKVRCARDDIKHLQTLNTWASSVGPRRHGTHFSSIRLMQNI